MVIALPLLLILGGLLTQLDQVIGTLLIANNLVTVTLSVITSWIFVNHFGLEHGLPIATFFTTAVLLVVGEITPKMFAVNHAEPVMFLMAAPLKLLMAVLR